MTKILMVCLGNICRSPLAQGIFEFYLPKDSFFIDSAGTAGYHIGNSPDRRSIQISKTYGIDISHQKCRQLTYADFDEFDIIYAMDKSNLQCIMNIAPKFYTCKIQKIMSLIESDIDVPDPYYGGQDEFENVFKMLLNAFQKFNKKYVS